MPMSESYLDLQLFRMSDYEVYLHYTPDKSLSKREISHLQNTKLWKQSNSADSLLLYQTESN